jgi:tetratricopeptide (TPR) repeat protein
LDHREWDNAPDSGGISPEIENRILAERGVTCSPLEQWGLCSAGLLPEDEAREMLVHASRCDACGAMLADMSDSREDLAAGKSPGEPLALRSQTESWKREMAARLEQDQRKASPARKSSGRPRVWWFAAAAAVAAAAIGTSSSSTLWLLAHSGERPSEFRIAGAPYQEVRPTRGRGGGDNPALLAARLFIALQGLVRSNDAAWLHAHGRAAILESREMPSSVDIAIDALALARLQAPKDIGILDDLGVALILRSADTSNTRQARAEDTARAIEVFHAALGIQTDPVALFNLALAYEQQLSYSAAVDAWNRFLQLEPAGGWADEARRRLAEIRSRQQNRLSPGPRLSEDAVLLLAANGFQPSGSLDATAVGQDLLMAHHDPWMRDLFSVRNPASSAGIAALEQTFQAISRGDASTGEIRAREAMAAFAAGGNRAGAAFAGFALAYAFQRQSKPEPGIVNAAAALPIAVSKGYHWLEIQLRLSLAVCHGLRQQLDTAYNETIQAEAIAHANGYSSLELRSLGMASGALRQAGSYREALAVDGEGLRRYWSGDGTRSTAYQFYYGQGNALDGLGYPVASAASMSEAVGLSAVQPDRTIEAMVRAQYGEILLEASQPGEAGEQLDRSQKLFAQFPQAPSSALYRAYALLSRARLDGQRGNAAEGLTAVREMEAAESSLKNATIEMALWHAKSELLTRAGMLSESEEPLRRLLALGDRARESQPSAGDRSALAHHVSDAVNLLADRYLAQGNVAEAWRVWTRYNSCFVTADTGEDGAARLIYASLPSGPVALAAVGGEFHAVRLTSGDEFSGLTGMLRRGVADPGQPIAQARDLGRRVAKKVFDPIEGFLRGTRKLYIAGDAPFSGIPFEALVSRDGKWLADRYRIVYSPPLGGAPYKGGGRAISLDSTLLSAVYGAERVVFGSRLQELPGVRAEAGAVAGKFPHRNLLEDSQATVANVVESLPKAEVFHFSGHAVALAGDAALVLAPDDSETSAGSLLWASKISPESFPKLRLVVLAACSTGRSGGQTRYPSSNLARAFLMAGVPQALATGWDVDSQATNELIREFYGELNTQTMPEEALYRAGLRLRQHAAYAHPYYWAAFEVFVR